MEEGRPSTHGSGTAEGRGAGQFPDSAAFARRAVHALRNPVGAILLSAESAIARADDPEAVRASLRRIVAQARRCGEILRELVDSVEGRTTSKHGPRDPGGAER